jgi:hypothetical protein
LTHDQGVTKGHTSVLLVVLLAVSFFAVGCGASPKSTASAPPSSPQLATTSPPTTAATAPLPSALNAEAQATATGDVPDNQVFLKFSNRAAGYSIKYPEGWAQRGSGSVVRFQDKNNLVRITVLRGTTASIGSVAAAMGRLAKGSSSLQFAGPTSVTLHGASAIKVVYSTRSAPNPVTGKRVELVVDRYYLSRAGRVAVVDLGTPRGVDNVDAYRLMIESFRWR